MKKRNSPVLALVCACLAFSALVPAACTSTMETREVRAPRLTFETVQPLAVNAGRIEIVNQYDPAADPRDVSSLFPAQPDIALRRYAEKRLSAAGTADTMRFIIDRASVYHQKEEPDNSFGQWLGVGRADRYDILMKVKVEIVPDGNALGTDSSVLTFRRSVSLPHSLSVAERERQQIDLIETMIGEVDKALTASLQQKMRVLDTGPAMMMQPAAPVSDPVPLSAPPVPPGASAMPSDPTGMDRMPDDPGFTEEILSAPGTY